MIALIVVGCIAGYMFIGSVVCSAMLVGSEPNDGTPFVAGIFWPITAILVPGAKMGTAIAEWRTRPKLPQAKVQKP